MGVGVEEHTYQWIEDWARIPDTAGARTSGRTHGVAVREDGSVLVFHEAGTDAALLDFGPDGQLRTSWGTNYPGAHGLTLVKEGGREYLWLADYRSGDVVKTSLAGERLLSLARPDLAVYETGSYSPTWVAVNEERWGGNGDVWVADGYGSGYVHRYGKMGNYLGSLDGTEGGGRFHHPHAVWADARKAESELYIADRFNRRIQVYDLDGRFKRLVGGDVANSPCGFCRYGDLLLVAEAPYRARLTILDLEDRLVTALGVNDDVCGMEGFPNDRALVTPGRFNSPHAVAATPEGDIYVVEWITGGRIIKLVKS